MKTSLKNRSFIGLAGVVSTLLLFMGGRAFAAINPSSLSKGQFTFINGSSIKGVFGSSGTFTFVDSNINDSTRNFVPPEAPAGNPSGFCDPGTVSGQGGVPGDIRFGVNIDSNANLSATNVPAQVKLGYWQGTKCQAVLFSASIGNPNSIGASDFQWSGDNITSFSTQGSSATFTVLAGSGGLLYAVNASNGCADQAILLDSPGGNSGKYYDLGNIPSFNPSLENINKDYPAIAKYFDNSKCYVKSFKTITIAGTASDNAKNGGGSTGGNSGGASGGQTCESSSNTALEWLMCPIFNIFSDMTNHLIGLFEGQLCFKTDIASTGTTATCNGGAFNTSGIKQAWDAIKNIVSALMVVIMLIAVLSQAASIGPIDAYTLRKLLPRLVAALILIQISFYLFSWVINVIDDIGEGLNSLLGSIFPSNINNLGNLLANTGSGINGGAGVFWLSVLAAIGFAVAALPTLLLLLVTAVFALLVGLAVLVFRKVLIITLLMLSPIALIAWILPGTERYWKMWWDNFLKILFMFPIIVLIIEAGRIFAWTAGSTSNGFIGVFLVFIGFFGPLFILPKTFRWGGALMQSAGSTIEGMSKPAAKMAGEGAKGYGERWQGEKAKQYNPTDKALGIRKGRFGIPVVYGRALRRVQSGHPLPTERSRRLAIAAGDKWAAERNDEANALVQRSYEKALSGGYLDGDGKRWRPGVGAAKQALVDIAGTDKKDDASIRAAQAADKMLLDTSSWIEMQSSKITTGANKGKRVFETEAFRSTLSNSPQHYSSTIRSRPDMAPDVLESAAQKDKSGEFIRDAQGNIVIDPKKRLEEAIKRLSPEDVPSIHQGFFEEIAELGDPEVSSHLAERLTTFAESGSPAGANAVASLQGVEVAKKVNAALGHGYDEIDEDTGQPKPDKHIEAFAPANIRLEDVSLARGGRRPAQAASAGPSPAAPTSATVITRTSQPSAPGELIVEHSPETVGPGTQFEGSTIYMPQERRARPSETPPSSGGAAPGAQPPPNTRTYTDFSDEDFGPGGRFPPPNA